MEPNEFSHLLQPAGSGECPGCGTVVPMFRFFGQLRHECDPCHKRDTAERIAKRRAEDALAIWGRITPDNFRQPIERGRISRILLPALDFDGTHGAGFAGASGMGKTRVAYVLLRRMAQRGHKPFAVSAAEYRQAAAAKHHSDPEVRAESVSILQSARKCAALLLDDVGKGTSKSGSSSDGSAGDEALYELLNERRDNGRLTVWTANGGSEWLRRKFGPDYGPAIIRRLVDLSRDASGKHHVMTT